jgi:hypothetical protein
MSESITSLISTSDQTNVGVQTEPGGSNILEVPPSTMEIQPRRRTSQSLVPERSGGWSVALALRAIGVQFTLAVRKFGGEDER